MTNNQLNRITDAIMEISETTNTESAEIILALIGVAWDEEEAGKISDQLAVES